MPTFDTHQTALLSAVFAQFGQIATRTGFPNPFPVCIDRGTAVVDGVSYEVNTALIYNSDAALAIGEKITVGSRTWEIDAVLERDELTITYTLRASS